MLESARFRSGAMMDYGLSMQAMAEPAPPRNHRPNAFENLL